MAIYINAEFNKSLDDALKTTDTDEITKLYAQAQSIAWEECPWIFLGVDNSLIGQKKYVKGIKYRPGGTILVTNIELVH